FQRSEALSRITKDRSSSNTTGSLGRRTAFWSRPRWMRILRSAVNMPVTSMTPTRKMEASGDLLYRWPLSAPLLFAHRGSSTGQGVGDTCSLLWQRLGEDQGWRVLRGRMDCSHPGTVHSR